MITKIITIFIVFCCTQIIPASAETPRLFMAQKGEQVAFFLPLVHLTTSVEKDAYLSTVIEPIFRRVPVMFEEAAPLAQIYPFALHPCSDEVSLHPSVQARLDRRFEAIKKYDNFHFPSEIRLLEPNFAKMMVVALGPISYNRQNLPPNYVWHPGQVSRLLAEKYGTRIESIDLMSDFHSAYCELKNTEEKSKEVSSLLDDVAPKKKFIGNDSSNYYRYLLAEAIQTLNQDGCYKNKRNRRWPLAAEKFLLYSRNRIWIEKIVNNTKENSLSFYGLGVAHFVNNKYDQGLFGLLKREGFEVTLIRTLEDVPIGILEMPLRTPIH